MAEWNFKQLLFSELVPASGCTEPISIALAAARAREVLAEPVRSADLFCSANIIKNVKGVVVPGSGGKKGIEAAAAMGFAVGDSRKGLQVLAAAGPDAAAAAERFLANVPMTVHLRAGEENLYISVRVRGENHSAAVTIEKQHDVFASVERDGHPVTASPDTARAGLAAPASDAENAADPGAADAADRLLKARIEAERAALNLDRILAYAEAVDFEEERDLKALLDRQIMQNTAIAEEGLRHAWGERVGKILADCCGDDADRLGIAMAAAGSDARMGGCNMPVVINSGSGNQGLTVSLPLIAAYEQQKRQYSRERLYRALLIANLFAIYLKMPIGKLSAFCGVVTAAAAGGVGLCYLEGRPKAIMEKVVVNTLGTISGMVCDGAKPSCAAKIASSLQTMQIARRMAEKGQVFRGGDGLVAADLQDTVANIGRLGREGMKTTDVEIVNIMIHNPHVQGGDATQQNR